MKTKIYLFLSLTVLFLGVSQAQNYEKEYRDFEASYNRGLLYSVHLKYWSHPWYKVGWRGVQKPLLRGLSAKDEVIRYAVFGNETPGSHDDCVIVVVEWFRSLRTIQDHFPDYIVTEIFSNDAAIDNRSVYHLKRK